MTTRRFAASAHPTMMARILWLIVFLTVLTIAVSIPADDQTVRNRGSAAVEGSSAPAQRLLREGENMDDVVGVFRDMGDRIAFYPAENEKSFRLLENLTLERVSRMIAESRGEREWNVSGVVTEFQGNNYLLLTRAVLKGP